MTTQTKPATNRSRSKPASQPAIRTAVKARRSPKADSDAKVENAAKPQTKRAQLIALLGAKTGADIEALSKTLGWQQHSIRAALTGLRKAGFEIARETPASGGAARYRITARPEPVAAQ